MAARFDEVYGAKVSKDTISRITDKVVEEMSEWQNRPLDAVYPVLFIDAIHVKVRDGQPTFRPFYVVIGVTVDGHRDILGIWAGEGGEGVKYWLHVLTEIKNRGVTDACIVVCDGLKGTPGVDHHRVAAGPGPGLCAAPDPQHLPLRLRKYWEQMARDLRPVYTAATEAAAEARFDEFTATWGGHEIHRVICSTNAIESINARYRRAVKTFLRGAERRRHRVQSPVMDAGS